MVPKHLFGIAADGVPHNYSAAGLNQTHGVAMRAPRGYTRSGLSIPLHLTISHSYPQLDRHAPSSCDPYRDQHRMTTSEAQGNDVSGAVSCEGQIAAAAAAGSLSDSKKGTFLTRKSRL